MLYLRCSRGVSAVSKLPVTPHITQNSVLKAASKRTFTSFTPLRPTIYLSTFRPSLITSTPSAIAIVATELPLDLLPKISTHPALGATQIRCGPRDTFSPSHFVRKRRHGFLSRLRTRKGRNTLARRRAKRRSTLSH